MFPKIILIGMWIVFGFPCVFAGGGHGQGGLLDLDPGLAFWTVITFVVLLAVLKKFAWKPLLESLDAREKYIRETITNAEENSQNAQQFLEETKKKLSLADSEAKTIVEKASHQATELRQQQVLQAEKECTNVKVSAQKQIQNLQTKAMEEMLGNVGKISVEIAGKVAQKSLSEKDHERLISDSIASMRNQLKRF